MLVASIDVFFAFLAACYELTLTLCFSCFILLLFVANKFLLLRFVYIWLCKFNCCNIIMGMSGCASL